MPLGTRQQPTRVLEVAVAAGVTLAVGFGIGYGAWFERRRRRRAAAVKSGKQSQSGSPCCSPSSCRCGSAMSSAPAKLRVRLLYGSTTGTSRRWASYVADELRSRGADFFELSLEDLATFQFDNLLRKPEAASDAKVPRDVVLVLLSTHTEGAAPENCEHFCRLLDDHVHDFRVDKSALQHLGFAVLGFGSSEYEMAGHYCTAAAKVDTDLAALAALRLLPVQKVTDTEDIGVQVQPWSADIFTALRQLANGRTPSVAVDLAAKAVPEVDKDSDSDDSSVSDADAIPGNDPLTGHAADDVEELAEGCSSYANPQEGKEKEMLTGKHRAQLKKEGYKLIGSHSAVKLCRWTKHQLRGRGGCYKHSFYGITSFQCMEATPSLACANKCVFCWRHHKNPVGTSWKWRMDEPDMIVAEGIDQHRRMIRECKGIPGVKKERFEEAMTVKHCALSLVGEPIMYPRINELVSNLHARRISTFLVTNAQFPEAIKALLPITQLYASVDAATPEALKAVDRPLFSDFWERFLSSLRALRDKGQRTVYRLTLMKGQNMDCVKDYARLVALGEPDFLEVKSVTFCGESKASSLKLENVPWHQEVKEFCEAMLAEEGLSESYELACEHQHSCIVLLAHKRYKINGQWHTWIDYERFHDLVATGRTDFDAMDYAAPTPDWAIYGSKEAGFDPGETRVYHNRTKRRAKAGQLSEAQLRQYPTDPATQ
mmetsp:Transcript_139705/g.243245  ORF Transcript_139705/g.243245 Transcript_139705/m.243245 type:complete len:713 (-) Transcript_139705:113-2251(-)